MGIRERALAERSLGIGISLLVDDGISPRDIFSAAACAFEELRHNSAKKIKSGLEGMWDVEVSRPAERLTPQLAEALLTVDAAVYLQGEDVWRDMLNWSIPDHPDASVEGLCAVAQILYDAFGPDCEVRMADVDAARTNLDGSRVIGDMIWSSTGCESRTDVRSRLKELASKI